MSEYRDMTILLTLTEKQAKALLVYLKALHEHGAGRDLARSFRAIRTKLERSMARSSTRDDRT